MLGGMDQPFAIVAAAEVPPRPGEWTCRQRRVRHVLLFLVLAGLGGGLLALPSLAEDVPTPAAVVAYFVGGWTALIALLVRGSAAGVLSAMNWRLRAAPDRIAVNFRSYQNAHFPQSPHVVLLPRTAIRAVRPFRQKVEAPFGRGVRRYTVEALEIVLRRESLPEIEAALQEESRRMGRGLLGVRSRSNHAPVRVDGNVLRVYWRSPHDALTPGLDEALGQLARWYPTQAPGLAEPLDPEAQLLELARAGDRMGAVHLASRLYGLDLTKAKQFVDELAGRP